MKSYYMNYRKVVKIFLQQVHTNIGSNMKKTLLDLSLQYKYTLLQSVESVYEYNITVKSEDLNVLSIFSLEGEL